MLGLSTAYYAVHGVPLYESVKRVSGLGFGLVELGAAHSYDPNVFEVIEKIKKDFPGKKFSTHGTFPQQKQQFWINMSEGLTERHKAMLDEMFRAAKIVDATHCAVHTGLLGKPVDVTGLGIIEKEADWARADCLKNADSFLKYALKLSGETKIPFLVENIGIESIKALFHSPEEFIALFRKYPELKMLFDVGHALFNNNLDELVSKLHPYIGAMHIHYSLKKSKINKTEMHAIFPKNFDFGRLAPIKQINKIPVVVEHFYTGSGMVLANANFRGVSEKEILEEKKLLESALSSL